MFAAAVRLCLPGETTEAAKAHLNEGTLAAEVGRESVDRLHDHCARGLLVL